MSDLKDFAEQGAALVAGVIALAGLSGSGLVPMAIPVATIAAIIYDQHAADARKIVAASAKTTLAKLQSCHEFQPQDLRAARAALDAVQEIRLSANELAVFLADPQPAMRLTERLFGTLAADTPATRQILTITMAAALESLRAGKLQPAITQDLVLAGLANDQAIAAELTAYNARVKMLVEGALADKDKIIAGQDRELTLTRELIVALARRVTPGIQDFDEARAELNRVIGIALEMQQRGALPSNFGGQVDAVLREVADLNARGEVHLASARLDEAIRQTAERHKAENLALFREAFNQASMLADAPKAAAMLHRVVELELPEDSSLFNVLRVLQDERYVRGRDFGSRFDLSLSVELARLALASATDDGQRSAALNDLAIALGLLGARNADGSGVALLREAIAAYTDALTVRTEADARHQWATTKNNLGNALGDLARRGPADQAVDKLREAIAAYTDALTVYTKDDAPQAWAGTKNNLGAALGDLARRGPADQAVGKLREAIDAYTDALTVYTKDDAPQHWAMTKNNLGAALGNLALRGPADQAVATLRKAVAAYTDALTVYTKDDAPQDWAATKNNLGNALGDLARRGPADQAAGTLREAVDAYTDALTVYTKDDAPQDWAMTKNNLGNALGDLAQRGPADQAVGKLREAIAAYTDALTVYTKDDAPQHWAMTKNNLGGALDDLARRGPADQAVATLREAVAAYTDALTVRTEADAPFLWAQTQFNLAVTYLALADTTPDLAPHLSDALAHVDAALRVYHPDHTPYDYDTATRLRDDILARLA